MKIYWIRFEPIESFRFVRVNGEVVKTVVPSRFGLGVGVTARDEADAIYLA